MEQTKRNFQNQVFDLIMYAGKILLENGAEIFRVEETMNKIGNAYNIKELDIFVMANGIFATMLIEDEGFRSGRSLHIPISPVHLGRITAVNRISREIVEGKYDVSQAMEEMKKAEQIPHEPNWIRVIFAGVGSAAFGFMLGGSAFDSIASFLAGVILYIFLIATQQAHTPEMLKIAFGGGLVTVVSIALYSIGIGDDFNHIMIGSIICLVPGVSLTTAVRNFFAGDYLSGTVRLVNALLVSVSISVGVGSVMLLWQAMR